MDNREELTVTTFVKDFFICYDKNRHLIHSMCSKDCNFILLGNRFIGITKIEKALLTMATSTHNLFNIDVHNIGLTNIDGSMFQVLCAGELEVSPDTQNQGFFSAFTIHFKNPDFKVLSYNERYLLPNLI